jgi:predicted nucleic acid-binding protein
MIIVDTTVWIDYFRGSATTEAAWLESELGRRRFALTDLILCEVLQGIRELNEFVRVRDSLLRCQVFAGGGVDLAVAAAQNYRTLRRTGYTVYKTIDCWIATFCLEGEHQLLHRDHDFDAFEEVLGLKVIHP